MVGIIIQYTMDPYNDLSPLTALRVESRFLVERHVRPLLLRGHIHLRLGIPLDAPLLDLLHRLLDHHLGIHRRPGRLVLILQPELGGDGIVPLLSLLDAQQALTAADIVFPLVPRPGFRAPVGGRVQLVPDEVVLGCE